MEAAIHSEKIDQARWSLGFVDVLYSKRRKPRETPASPRLDQMSIFELQCLLLVALPFSLAIALIANCLHELKELSDLLICSNKTVSTSPSRNKIPQAYRSSYPA